ncbi:MAG TPA: carboxymuconolactone decarboxylase family protein [Acidimicrobiales bacterium]|nr:carboxymuconolactone decarboxylase family protein [Acidimicrobiales bacterium]
MATIAARTNVYAAWPEGYRAWYQLSKTVYASGLDTKLLNLVMLRASQINGCAYCLELHAREAREAGEEQRRLDTLAGWRDVPWFHEAERAALALTEAVTRLGQALVPDDVVDEALRCFGEDGFAKLLLGIVVINGWNRINVTTHVEPER